MATSVMTTSAISGDGRVGDDRVADLHVRVSIYRDIGDDRIGDATVTGRRPVSDKGKPHPQTEELPPADRSRRENAHTDNRQFGQAVTRRGRGCDGVPGETSPSSAPRPIQ